MNHTIHYNLLASVLLIMFAVYTYLSILCSKRVLHTARPFLHTYLQTLPSEASALVLPAALRRRWSLVHRVVSSSAGGHLVGAIISCIRSDEQKRTS